MRMEELLQKLKDRDLSAYNYVYETYGWELHNYLLDKCPDKEMSSAVFRKAINAFCEDLAGRSETDQLELILRTYADRALMEIAQPAKLPENFDLQLPERSKPVLQMETIVPADASAPSVKSEHTVSSPVFDVPPIELKPYAEEENESVTDAHREEERSQSAGIGRLLLVFLLLAAIAVVVWAVLGLVMKMGWIPGFRFDWGYSWFNQNIAPWF